MNHVELICAGLILLAAPGWAQVTENTSVQPVPVLVGVDTSSDASDDRMQTPPAVSGEAYPTTLSSQERSNYLHAGVSFTSAYSDNTLGPVNGNPVSDVSYSIAPMVAVDLTRPRLHTVLTYAPGFTFYQRTSDRNEADQNAAIEFEYRLSPHVTFSARDQFQKSSNVFNQPDLTSAGTVSGGAQGGNFSVIAPIADRLSNSGNVGLSYQYARNSMVGASGSFSNLHYPTPDQVPGLSDSRSQGGLAFYSWRISKVNYFGVTYEYQRLLSYPTSGLSETQTHAALFFYTLAPSSRFSITVFGGPQHSDTVQPLPLLPTRGWTPAAGASLGWQGRVTSFALGYEHVVASGGGLTGAVQLDSASASIQQRITKTLNGSVSSSYSQNNILGSSSAETNKGHSVSGTAALQQQLGQHLGLQLGYTRLHQSYSSVAILAATPDTNREFVSLSYQFSRPLGR
jgi:hypothetical protein